MFRILICSYTLLSRALHSTFVSAKLRLYICTGLSEPLMSDQIERKIVNILLSIGLNICFVCSKNYLSEMLILVPATYILVDKEERSIF